MSRKTHILRFILDRIYQEKARPQWPQGHEYIYHRVPGCLPRVSDRRLGIRDTGRRGGENIRCGVHVSLGTTNFQTISRSSLLKVLVKHHRKLLDSLPKRYCPNPKCSVLVQIDEDHADPKAQCLACFQWVYVPCEAMWHNGGPHENSTPPPRD